MATARPFAYNTGSVISGTIQVGDLAVGDVGTGAVAGSGVVWWNGPDEDLGYVIAVPVSDNTQPTPIPGVFASVGFWGTAIFASPFSDTTFINLVNQVFSQSLTSGIDAAIWLFNNGYWTNYPLTSNTDASDYILQFVSAGGTIDSTITSALDVLFNDLQNNLMNGGTGPTFYSVLEGFYPILGTTPATQSINANGNTNYDLQFSGGWIRNSLGMQANGINTSAYTGKDYGLVTYEELWNTHFSIYGTVPNNTPINKADLSVGNGSDRTVSITLNNGRFEYDCGDGIQNVNPNSGNFVIISCDSGGSNTFSYINGNAGDGCGDAGYVYSTQGLYFGFGTSIFGGCQVNVGVSENTYGWASFGGFMESLDMATYQTIVNTFMTSIGRNTY
jgi:hypothetical protein